MPLERTSCREHAYELDCCTSYDETGPFRGFTEEDMKNAHVVLYVMLQEFDDVFANYVQQRTSYTFNEILFNRKFVPMYRESNGGKRTILELHKLNIHKKV